MGANQPVLLQQPILLKPLGHGRLRSWHLGLYPSLLWGAILCPSGCAEDPDLHHLDASSTHTPTPSCDQKCLQTPKCTLWAKITLCWEPLHERESLHVSQSSDCLYPGDWWAYDGKGIGIGNREGNRILPWSTDCPWSKFKALFLY